jgi:hypothetical protein
LGVFCCCCWQLVLNYLMKTKQNMMLKIWSIRNFHSVLVGMCNVITTTFKDSCSILYKVQYTFII